MTIKLNTIVTLENNLSYVVLSETMYQAEKYFLMMELDEKREVVPNKVGIFKEEKEANDTYIIKIEDPTLLATLTNLLKKQI